MGRRLVSVIGRVKGGAARGGTGRTIKFWDDEALSIASTIYQRSSGGGTQPNPLTPNAGIPTTLLVDRAAGDAFVTVASVASFNVGDLIPIYNGVNTVYKVITIITPGTRRLDLDQTLGFAFLASNTIVNAADMEGHIWGWLDDATDKFAQVTEVASGRKLPPLEFPIAVPLASIAVYEEGTIAGTRPNLNFIGATITAVDNGGANRVDVTVAAAPVGASFVTMVSEAGLTAEAVLGTAVIMEGTTGARPAAATAGRLYNDTTVLALYRDTGAAWTQVTPPINADYVVGTAHAQLSAELVLGTAVIMAGTLGSRPAAALNGRLYLATDDNGGTEYRDTGAAWVQTSSAMLHAARHNSGGADVMAIDAAAGTGSLRTLGTGATNAAAGNHAHTFIQAKNGTPSVTWTTSFGGTPVVTIGTDGGSDSGGNVTAKSSTGATGFNDLGSSMDFIAMMAN